ncbi:helix-turn-helix domain-containing protein [Demequina silvatica]|uniref:helix-turn-helix domain-containing protein n=1 Tax=Demequina silvatica TaxID=1638988 RepID=UPI000785C63D|nr:helix-turn-helix domain-containing protein [Demequina silvatica]
MNAIAPALTAIRDKATIPLWPDAAKIMGVGKTGIYAAAAAGEIPTVRLGRRILVPVPKLLAMLGEQAGGEAA